MVKVTYSKSRFDRNDVATNLLAFAAGTTDVLSFVGLGEVFTSAMTGNTALLGIAVGHGHALAAARSFDALFGYLFGVAAGTVVQGQGAHRHELAAVLWVETAFLAAFAVIWAIFGHSGEELAVYALIFTLAVAMGLQSVAARIWNLPGIPTVVFTSTLTSIVMGVVSAAMKGIAPPLETARQIVAFATYTVGAFIAGFIIFRDPDHLIALPLAAVIITLALQYRPHPVQ